MRSSIILSSTLLGLASASCSGMVQGFDVSAYQPDVDMQSAYDDGARWVYIKATENTDYKSPSFSSQYDDATSAGLIRGGYHFANPGVTSGADQATYFYENGGGWSGDGITLPGMLDLESGSSEGSSECWGLSSSEMVDWIQDFVDTYQSKTTRYPVIYTSPSWWEDCTGNSEAFKDTCPLDMADWASEMQTPPGGWPYATFWQYADTYSAGGDADCFNGDSSGLSKMATG